MCGRVRLDTGAYVDAAFVPARMQRTLVPLGVGSPAAPMRWATLSTASGLGL